jgi:hypothetical protein
MVGKKKKRRRRKSPELSAEEKRVLEVKNRLRAKRNARIMHDPHDHRDLMHRTRFYMDRIRLIGSRVKSPDVPVIDLVPWRPLDRVVAVIILPGDRLLLRNPESRKKRNRRSKSSLDMYFRLPSAPVPRHGAWTDTTDHIVTEATGSGSVTRIGSMTDTCSVTGRSLQIAIYRATVNEPAPWGWMPMPATVPELCPEEDTVLRSALASIGSMI